MGDQLKPDTSEKMRALCKKISVAHNLDAEIQEELYAHMEDKLIAYMNGDETFAEEDALILVREHFGDPSQVKALFQKVHGYDTNVRLYRRLAAAMVVTMAVSVIFDSLGITLLRLPPETLAFAPPQAVLACVYALTIVFSWLFLWRWQRRLDMGHTPWFLTWRPLYLACVIAALFFLESRTDTFFNLLYADLYANAAQRSFVAWSWNSILIIIPITMHPVFICMVWLWWCDRPPRQARAMRAAAGCWVVWSFLFSFSPAYIDTLVKRVSLWPFMPLSDVVTSITLSFTSFVAYALVACALYKAGQYTLFHKLG